MKFLDELEKILKDDERFIGEDNQVIKTKVSDAARGEDVIIVTRGKNAVFNRVLKLPQSHKTTNWCAV